MTQIERENNAVIKKIADQLEKQNKLKKIELEILIDQRLDKHSITPATYDYYKNKMNKI